MTSSRGTPPSPPISRRSIPARALTVLRTLCSRCTARASSRTRISKALGLDKPVATATFWKKDGSQIKLLLGTKDKSEVPAMLAGDKTVFALPDYSAQQFVKKPADFKKARPALRPSQMAGHPMPGRPMLPPTTRCDLADRGTAAGTVLSS